MSSLKARSDMECETFRELQQVCVYQLIRLLYPMRRARKPVCALPEEREKLMERSMIYCARLVARAPATDTSDHELDLQVRSIAPFPQGNAWRGGLTSAI